MFYDQGCFGRVELGDLPRPLGERLAAIPGEWLEFDPPSGAIVVRHVEPTSTKHLPTIARELVRIFSEIPAELHSEIPGGDLFVHTEDEQGQLVRIRVEPGGSIRIQWAHPDFKRALRRPYTGGNEIAIDPEVQRLNGKVVFSSPTPEQAMRAIEELVDTFEGLYPEGECAPRLLEGSTIELTLREVNLDATRLVALLEQVANPRSLSGRLEVSSFGKALPEQRVRFLFEAGKVWVQHPLLWTDINENE